MKHIITALLLTLSPALLAAPTIESVSGSLAPGSTITIEGSGFTTGPDLVLYDRADTHALLQGDTLRTGLADQHWTKQGSPWAKPLTPTETDEGTVYQGPGKTYNGWPAPLKSAGLQSIYINWRYRPSESPGHAGGSNKFIRVWDASSGEKTRLSWTGMHMTYSGNSKPSWNGFSGTPNQWNRMALWIDATTGTVRARINGKLIHSIDDFEKQDTPEGLNIALIGFDPSSATPYKNMITQLDDIYVSDTRARVVTANAPTWTEAQITGTHQMPVSWADSRITFTATDPLGSYVYVVDQSGDANPIGYPLCIKCPRAPVWKLNEKVQP